MDKWIVSIEGYGEVTVEAFNYSNAIYKAYEVYKADNKKKGDNEVFKKFKSRIKECYQAN